MNDENDFNISLISIFKNCNDSNISNDGGTKPGCCCAISCNSKFLAIGHGSDSSKVGRFGCSSETLFNVKIVLSTHELRFLSFFNQEFLSIHHKFQFIVIQKF